METDRDIAERIKDARNRARDYRLLELPAYMAWSERALAGGESEALIAHLDATSMWLLPEDIDAVGEAEFDELLEDLRTHIADD